MIRNNLSVVGFENGTTKVSSRASSRTVSPLPGGYYLYDDPCGSTSPSRYSPQQLTAAARGDSCSSCSTVTSSSVTCSPSKVVALCKNCSFSFRVRCSRSADFCCRDCETCFTVFGKGAFYSSSTPHKTVEEVRKSIYEFQNQLQEEEERQRKEKVHLEAVKRRVSQEDYEGWKVRTRLEKQILQGMGSVEEHQPFAVESQDQPIEKNPVIWALNPAAFFFKAPKPVRPQLHTFI